MKIIGEETKQGSPHSLLTANRLMFLLEYKLDVCFVNVSVVGFKTDIFKLQTPIMHTRKSHLFLFLLLHSSEDLSLI